MSVSTAPAPTEAAHQRATFFRQSGWLMIANVAGGVLMWAVHLLAKRIPEAEYGVFGTMLALIMCIPTMPLQMIFAQQTARALATRREGELSGMIRLVWVGTFVIWAVASLVVLLLQGPILARWQISNPVVLWITLPVLLMALWSPMFFGMLQGRQNFLWLGWAMMLNGVARLGLSAVVVMALVATAAGMMVGVLAGLGLAVVIAIWHTRELWLTPTQSFDWRRLLAQVLPLMAGFGAFQFLFTADTMFVKAYFSPEDTAFYVSAGTLSRALMWLVAPLAAVMFPKIVHSTARAEKSDLMGMVLLGTAVLAVMGALGLWLLGPWVVKLIYKSSYVEVATQVLPWYAFAMVPLALANVLLNNLLARSAFRVVPVLLVLAIAYGLALTKFNASLVMVLQTMGAFNLLMFAACAWFTWRGRQPDVATLPPAPGAAV